MKTKIEILRASLEYPNISCGVGHELNMPHQTCVYGETPRYRIGCMHSDLPLLLSECIQELSQYSQDSKLSEFQERLVEIKTSTAVLDNMVYEGELLETNMRLEEQAKRAHTLRAIITRFLKYYDASDEHLKDD